MAYKTILVHADDTASTAERIEIAGRLALTHQAHLMGLALTGVARFSHQHGAQEETDPHLKLHLDFLRQRARAALSGFEAQVRTLGVASFEQQVLDDEAGGGVSLLARYADLVVIGQINPAQPSTSVMRDFPAYVVLHSSCPVLIVPYAPALRRPWAARHILIAWNASKEASRAVCAGLPLLQQAQRVDIAIFDPEHENATHASAPGTELALYLARHGVRSNVQVLAAQRGLKRPADIGQRLLSQAADAESDLLLMGAYGRSRFRETILGGVTQTLLKTMTIPVLMAH